MTSILFIGNGNELADQKARDLCLEQSVEYKGLLDTELPEYDGGFHTSIYDLSYEKIKDIAKNFNKVVLLDQSDYQTVDDFSKTIELVHDLEKITTVIFVDPSYRNEILKLLDSNPTFCLAPFISMYVQEDVHGKNIVVPCCWYKSPLAEYTSTFNYENDPGFSQLRTDLLDGKQNSGCGTCYQVEQADALSYRTRFSKEWALKLGISKIEELKAKPAYYDIRLGNKCNMMCRTCNPGSSNLIDKEYFSIKLESKSIGTTRVDNFDLIDTDELVCLYIAGGEPSINEEFIKFIETCIEKNHTDFELIINTNALVITDYFLSLMSQFKKVKFEISLDGIGKINKYIRWPGEWTKIHENINRLKEVANQRISFNSVISIYNISNLYWLFEYIDTSHPKIESHISYTFDPEFLAPWKFPRKELVLQELEKVKSLKLYANQEFRSKIQGLVKLVTDYKVSNEETIKFFEWNDLLDKSRKIKLGDYIPELEKCRIQ